MRKRLLDFILASTFLFLLVAVLTPTVCRKRPQDEQIACHSNLKNIGTAMEMYSCDWDGHYPRNLQTLVPDYLIYLPQCPSVNFDTYRATFGSVAPTNPHGYPHYFYLECAGQNHEGLPANTPFHDSLKAICER